MSADLVWIFLSAMVVNNFTLFYFLGLCPFMGVSGRVSTALRMGAADVFVLVIIAGFLSLAFMGFAGLITAV